MNDIDITLFLNEYRVKALEEALGKRTAETIEDKLSEEFDVLYQEYVDDEQRASIEAKIECEEAAEQARIEAKRRFAIYHVRENGEDYHFTSDHFRSPMQAAYRYRLYDRNELSANPQTLTAAFIETNPISLKKFNDACTDINSDKRITALVEFDLDEGRVSVCDNSDNEWQTFTRMIFQLQHTRHIDPITAVKIAAAKFLTAVLPEKKSTWIKPRMKLPMKIKMKTEI